MDYTAQNEARSPNAAEPFPLLTTPTSQLRNGVKPGVVHRCASEMACVHNMILRGLNSIYRQAKFIQPKDVKSFLGYSLCFYDLVRVHHGGEEEILFPYIENMTENSGIMGRNIKQHHAFHEGLEAFKGYIDTCLDGNERFNGQKLVDIIDSFGTNLSTHLAEEISTILALSKYEDEKLNEFEKKFTDWSEKDVSQLSPAATLTWGFFNHDKSYEDGLWAKWPPAPAPLVFVLRWGTYWVHSDWWRFASCDRNGVLRDKLYAEPEELENVAHDSQIRT